MEIAELILEYIKVLIWPFVALIAMFKFKPEFAELFSSIKKLKLPGGTEIDWAKTVEEAEQAAEAIKNPTRELSIETAEEKAFIEQSIRHSLDLSPSYYNFDSYLDMAEKDHNLALAGVRIEIEKILRNMAQLFSLELPNTKSSINVLMNELRKAYVLEDPQYKLLQSITKLANEAIHGNNVRKEYAVRAIESAKIFLEYYIPLMTGGMDRIEFENA